MTVALIHPDNEWRRFINGWLPEAYPNEPCYINYYFSVLSFLGFGMEVISLYDIVVVDADISLVSPLSKVSEEVLEGVYPWINHVKTFSQLTEAVVFEIKAKRPNLPILIFSHRQVPSVLSITEGVDYLEKTSETISGNLTTAIRQAVAKAKLAELRKKY